MSWFGLLGAISVGRFTHARQRDTSDAEIGETQTAAGSLDPADRLNARARWIFVRSKLTRARSPTP